MRRERVTLTPQPVQPEGYTPKPAPLSATWGKNPLGLSAKNPPRMGEGTLTNQVPGPAEGEFQGGSSPSSMDSDQKITLKNLIGG